MQVGIFPFHLPCEHVCLPGDPDNVYPSWHVIVTSVPCRDELVDFFPLGTVSGTQSEKNTAYCITNEMK